MTTMRSWISRAVFSNRSKRKARRPRQHPAVAVWLRLEDLESREVPSATVMMDQSVYYPGDTASITGSGYAPNETVNLNIVLATGTQATSWSVADDANGNFSTSVTMPSDGSWSSSSVNPLTLTATGQTSGLSAQTTFTDPTVTRTFTLGVSPSAIVAGTSNTLTFTITNVGSGPNATTSGQNIQSLAIAVPTGYTVTSDSITNANAGETWTLQPLMTASQANATYGASPGFIPVPASSGSQTVILANATGGDATKLKPGQFLTITVTVTAPTPGATSTTWAAEVFVGLYTSTTFNECRTGSPPGFNNTAGNSGCASSPTTPVIVKGIPTVHVTDAGGTYNGNPFPATDSVAGTNGVYGSTLEGVGLTLTYYAGSTATGTPLAGAPSTAGTYTVVASFPGSTDYTSASAQTTFTIAKATPTVSVSDAGGTYNGNPFPATDSVTGISGVAGSSLEGVSPTLTYYVGTGTGGTNLGSTAPTTAGTYTVVASFAGSTDYTGASAQTTFTIAKANVIISVTPYSVTYDGNAHTATGTATGVESPTPANLTGLLNLSGTTHTTAGTYSDTWTFAGNTNYNSTSGTVTDVIAKATPTVSVSDAGGTYNGSAFPATDSVTGVSGVAGSSLEGTGLTLTYYVGTGTGGANLGSTAPTTAGTYTVVASFAGSTDYNAASAQTTFTIAKATPTVSVSDAGGTYNGNPFPATDSVTGVSGIAGSSLEGVSPTLTYYAGSTATGTPLAGAPTTAGTYTVVASFAGSTDYNSASSSPVTFTIAKATPTVSVSDAGGTYNGNPFPATDSVTGVSGVAGSNLEGTGLTLTYYSGSTATGTPLSGAPVHAGTYTVVASFAGSTDYNSASAQTTFTINPYAFTYQIGNASQTYGSPVNLATALGTTVSTGVNGENLAIAYASTGDTATAHVVGSPYAITGSLSNGTGQLSDYSVTLKNGQLTVNPYAFTYQIGNASQTYGSPVNLASALPGTVSTGVNGENLAIAYSSTGDTATAHVVGSPYAITGTLSNGTGQLSDYSVTLKNGNLSVNPYAFTYQIGNASQTYGSPVNLASALPGTVSTGVNGENLSIAYASTGDTATAHVVGSPYAITGTLANGTGQVTDYSVTLLNGQLTVNPYAFTYQIGNDSHLYGVTDNLAADLGTTISTGVNGENLSIAYSSTGNVATAAVATYAITGTLSNGTGQLSDYSVTLKNGTLTVNPRASSTGVSLAVSTINEGSSTTVTITVSDASGGTTNGVTSAGVNVIPSGTITLSLSGTNNVGQSDMTLSASSCTLTANANGTATCTVTVNGLDNPGGTISASYAGDATHTGSSGSAALAVLNVAPTVGAITAPIAPQNITTTINTSANFTDPGILDTHTAVWNWGDNTTSTGAVTESNGSGSVTGSHVYSTDGVYTITLTVTDKDGGVGTSIFQYVVIYNPNAGFVTGGGWIVSPTGALVSSPSLTGRANFGFVSKYLPGRSTPDGQTEFQFQLGNFNFHSTSYDWLTIINNMAQYQGNGTINGSGNYKFVLTGVDGDLLGGTGPDTFRIRIWDPNANPSGNGSNYVYDNYPSGNLYNDPSGTPLSGGEIQIHKANQTAAGGQGHHLGLAPLTTEQLQPIWTAALARWQAAGATPEQLSLLAHYTVQIVNVPSGVLAMTGPGIIWISPDAAGHGWFIDPTPLSDLAGRPTPNRMDLLSVVAHEMGHVILNMDESAALNDVMTEALPEGVRRLPTPADLGKTEVVAAQTVDTSLAVVPAILTTDSLTDTVLNPANDVRTDNALDGALLSLALNQPTDASPRQVPAVSSAAGLLDNVLSQFQGISLDDGVLDGLARDLVR